MNFIWDKLTEWLKEMLVDGVMDALTGLFDNVNEQIAGIAGNVGATPQTWNGTIFGMVRSLSDNVVVPIAGMILALVATLELIQLLVDRNNMHDFDVFLIYKWAFKTAASVLIVSNTWNIVMGIFDATQSMVSRASGVITGSTNIGIDNAITDLEARLTELELGELFSFPKTFFDSLPRGRVPASLSIPTPIHHTRHRSAILRLGEYSTVYEIDSTSRTTQPTISETPARPNGGSKVSLWTSYPACSGIPKPRLRRNDMSSTEAKFTMAYAM